MATPLNRLREYREAAGETLRDLAIAVDMDHSHLSKIERGERGCVDEKKVALAAHFHVTVGALFFPSDVETESTTELVGATS